MKNLASSLFLIGLCAITGQAVQAQGTNSCDRVCLEGIVDQYLAAMVAHDASRAPFTDNVIYTENTVRLPPSEGLWFTASGLSDYGFKVADVSAGQVAWVGMVNEHDKPVLMSVRLKVVNRRITEAEQIVARNLAERNLANLKTVPPSLRETLAPSERIPRAEMLHIPDLYFEALDILSDRKVPFDDSCYRIENGMVTAGTIPGGAPRAEGVPVSRKCANGDVPPALKTIHNVSPRRTPIVDEERGITWGVYCFNHRGLAEITMPDGKTYPSYSNTPNTMPFVEIFRTKNGRITDIFAIGTTLPYGSGDGWAGPQFK